MAGSYDVVISNSVGAVTSTMAIVSVTQNPLLLVGLTNQTVDAGSNVLLAASVVSSYALAYSWALNGVSIPGTNSFLILSNVQPVQSGYYRVTAMAIANKISVSSTGRVTVLRPMSYVAAWGDNSAGRPPTAGVG